MDPSPSPSSAAEAFIAGMRQATTLAGLAEIHRDPLSNPLHGYQMERFMRSVMFQRDADGKPELRPVFQELFSKTKTTACTDGESPTKATPVDSMARTDV